MTVRGTTSESASNAPAAFDHIDSPLHPQRTTTDQSTFTQTNSKLNVTEKKLSTFSPKRVLTAGLYGIAGGGFIFGMLASCTVLGGIAGVILGFAAAYTGNFLLQCAIIMLIGAFKEPDNSNYTIDFFTKMNVKSEKHYPIPVTTCSLTTISLITTALISFIALGGTQGIILSLALTTTACSLDFLLDYLSYDHPQFFYHQQQSS